MVFFFSGETVKVKRNLKMRNENVWLITLVQTNGLSCWTFFWWDVTKESLFTHNGRDVSQIPYFLIKITWDSFHEFRWRIFYTYNSFQPGVPLNVIKKYFWHTLQNWIMIWWQVRIFYSIFYTILEWRHMYLLCTSAITQDLLIICMIWASHVISLSFHFFLH